MQQIAAVPSVSSGTKLGATNQDKSMHATSDILVFTLANNYPFYIFFFFFL